MGARVSRRTIARTIADKLSAEPGKRDAWIKTLAAYLVENGMDEQADLIANDIARELYNQNGHLLANVASAHELSAGVREELARLLKDKTGSKVVEISETTDKSLLGGLVVRTPDAVWDISVRNKLRQLASL